MALVQRSMCDSCNSEKNVEKMVVVYGYGTKATPWEVDVCGSCYAEMFGDLKGKSRRPSINNVRPPHKFAVTPESEFTL